MTARGKPESEHATVDGPFPKAAGKVAARELTNAGYSSAAALSGVSRRELLKIHGVGQKSLRVINEFLIEQQLPPLDP